MRLGLFGGSFDPPHRAHLEVARAAADAFGLEKVLLVPTGRQPLKSSGAEASWDDRMAMVRLLCAEDPRLEPSELEAPHPDGSPNYTVSTLTRLKEIAPAADIFALIGADAFADMHRWKDAARLTELAEWIVVSRPGFDLQAALEANWELSQRRRFHLLETLSIDLSATQIRERLHLGISPGDALPAAVILYISRMHLYHR